MIDSPPLTEFRTRRQPVAADHVACWRAGPGPLDRCRECVYLLRLEPANEPASAAHVVCSDDTEPE
ncbi:MAG: hypothetical protein QOI85_2398 [Chloroflexota bacterium]|jgi:hypothetical protein|nr:hypothetical protein [Chloroflexota bacterium]